MRCSKCNFENSPNVRFCVNCGTPLISATPVQPHAEPSQKPVNPSPKPKAIKKPKADRAQAANLIKTKVFFFLQLFIYLLLAAGSVLFLFLESGITVHAEIGNDVSFSFFSVITSLISGTARYNPTVLSIVISFSTIILAFGSTAFWLYAFVMKIIGKFHKESRLLALIVSFASAAAISLFTPLAYNFSGIMAQICAKNANILYADIISITSVWAYVFSGLIILLTVAVLFFAAKETNLKKGLKG